MTSAGFIEKTTFGFGHVTTLDAWKEIERRGFNIPTAPVVGEDEFQTLGGLYVATNLHERWSDLAVWVCGKYGVDNAVVVEVVLPEGLPFALDEDEIDGLAAGPQVSRDFGRDSAKIADAAVRESLNPRRLDRLDLWSRKLAARLNQEEIHKYALRVFKQPQIVGARRLRPCGERAGRSSGRVYPSERSPAFIASLPAERRALAERFLRVLSGRAPLWARFHEYLAEAPVGEIQADVAEREAAHARRGEQAKADAREEAQRRRKFRGAMEVEVDPKDRRKQRLSGQDVWLYHGTTSKLLPKIRKEGLCPDPPRRAAPDTSSGYVYLTARAGNAMDRGGDAVFYARQAVGVFGGEPVVLRVRVPWDALGRDEDDSDIGTYHYQYRFAGCVRPEQIAEVLKV